MTNSKTTRKALLSSALAMTMCVAMLIATTFAWFTDTASTSVNKIQAGTLDVTLEMAAAWDENGSVTEWKTAEGETLSFLKANANGSLTQDNSILWEPGCTYRLPELRISNNGNLALKYKIAITGIQGSAELNRVIDWTIANDADDTNATDLANTEYRLTAKDTDGASDILTIKGHMQETAGNDYQGESIEGISITVYATQDTAEFDSSTDQYDVSAMYPLMPNINVSVTKEADVNEDSKLTTAVAVSGSTIPAGTVLYTAHDKEKESKLTSTAISGGTL